MSVPVERFYNHVRAVLYSQQLTEMCLYWPLNSSENTRRLTKERSSTVSNLIIIISYNGGRFCNQLRMSRHESFFFVEPTVTCQLESSSYKTVSRSKSLKPACGSILREHASDFQNLSSLYLCREFAAVKILVHDGLLMVAVQCSIAQHLSNCCLAFEEIDALNIKT